MDISESFHSAVDSTLLAFDNRIKQHPQLETYERYKSHLKLVSQRYTSKGITANEIRKRFIYEVASISTLIAIINEWFCLRQADPFASMTVNGIKQYFPIFKLPATAIELCIQIAQQIDDAEEITHLLESASTKIFDRTSRDTLSEYYTSDSIAEQLVSYALPGSYDELTRLKVVDPACGHGSLVVLVAKKYIERGLRIGKAPGYILRWVIESLHGFDVHPYSVIFTRLNLLVQSAPLFIKTQGSFNTPHETLFHNIKLYDPLQNGREFWSSGPRFDIVITNPPFAKIVNKRVPFVKDYSEVIYGHSNLHQLFLWWAIKTTRPGGRISFLLPQSFRSGQYFKNLRAKISETCTVHAFTHIGDGINAFKDVEQPLACISLYKRNEPSRENRVVNIDIFENGTESHQLTIKNKLKVSRNQLLRDIGKTTIWVVSDHKEDYGIFDRVFTQSKITFGEVASIKVGNGGFVWNQHKKNLVASANSKTKPLVYSASISPFILDFPIHPDSNQYHHQFVKPNSDFDASLYKSETVVIQRTTGKKFGRRIVSALIQGDCFPLHQGYFIENHVNVIQDVSTNPQSKKMFLLWGLTGWLNSRLLNLVFGMMNGSAHLSVYELLMFPFPTELIPILSLSAKRVSNSYEENYAGFYEELDALISDYFQISKKQREKLKARIQ